MKVQTIPIKVASEAVSVSEIEHKPITRHYNYYFHQIVLDCCELLNRGRHCYCHSLKEIKAIESKLGHVNSKIACICGEVYNGVWEVWK